MPKITKRLVEAAEVREKDYIICDDELRGFAVRVLPSGKRFRTLYNQHDTVAFLRRGSDDRYWHGVIVYAARENLQAVLDEYVHCLVEAEGLIGCAPHERVQGLARVIHTVLSLRPSQIEVDDLQIRDGRLHVERFTLRGRFAMRLADYRDEEGAAGRLTGLRDAFNSPFRPFVLATTSIGQEGLDFHLYCYRV